MQSIREPITIWSISKKYNHFECGWVNSSNPTPYTEGQKKLWSNNNWDRKYGYKYFNYYVISGGWIRFCLYYFVWDILKYGIIKSKIKKILKCRV